MVCYHLLHKYSGDSHTNIAKAFGRKRGSALYFIHKCHDILSIPGSYGDFVEQYEQVEGSAAHFIAGLKRYNDAYIRAIGS